MIPLADSAAGYIPRDLIATSRGALLEQRVGKF